MYVIVRGNPSYTTTEVLGLDVLGNELPKLYVILIEKLGYVFDFDTGLVKNKRIAFDSSCSPDGSGRQILLKPYMYPTDVLNLLSQTGGFSVCCCTQEGDVSTWTLRREF